MLDTDVSGLLSRELTLEQAGDLLIDDLVRTANGRLRPPRSSVTGSS